MYGFKEGKGIVVIVNMIFTVIHAWQSGLPGEDHQTYETKMEFSCSSHEQHSHEPTNNPCSV